MFLSNPYRSFLLAVVCLMLMQGCGSTPTNENSLITVIPESKSGFPFATKEPEVYQGDQVINGDEAARTFVARKGDRWRYDHYREGSWSRTELKTDKLYALDHLKKVYTEEPLDTANSFNMTGFDYFRGKEHWDFDMVGIEGGVVRYKVRQTDHMTDEILISVDEKSGMIIRQEFADKPPDEGGAQPRFVYELRNLKLDVDDAVFTLPDGYRKVSAKEFRNLIKK